MGFISRPLSDLSKLNSLDLGVLGSGRKAARSGQPFDPSMGELWCWGWQLVANEMSQKAGATSCR